MRATNDGEQRRPTNDRRPTTNDRFMKIVTATEMRAIDRATSERFGVPSLTLMENAGTAVAEHVLSRYGAAQKIVVFCGKGNNGGDGFVAARQLHEAGKTVQVILLADRVDLRGDAAVMFENLPISPIVVHSSEDLNGEQVRLTFPADLYIDAILGAGFKPPVSGLYAEAIALLNASHVPVVAVDIPSGADADAMGQQQGIVARADSIVTFTAPRTRRTFSVHSLPVPPACCRDWIAARSDCFIPATQRDYCRRLCAADRAASGGLEQGQVWSRATGWRIARQGRLGGDGGDGCATNGSGPRHRGDSGICVGYRCWISSRADD